jgi:Flp pilus assembly protein TadD
VLPPQVPENAAGSTELYQAAPPTAPVEFRETATDEQRFHVHVDFGRVFESQGDFDNAALEYQQAITALETARRGRFQSADHALAHRRMAGALDRLGRFAQAEVHYKKALKFSPKDPKVWNDAGYSYYLQGRWSDAESALKTASRLAPQDERIRINLGLTLAAQGRSQEALPLLSLSNGDAVGHTNLGYLLASTGQAELARREYELALSLRPDLQLARRALAQLDRQQRGQQFPTPTPDGLMAKHAPPTPPPIDPTVLPASTTRASIPPPHRTADEVEAHDLPLPSTPPSAGE